MEERSSNIFLMKNKIKLTSIGLLTIQIISDSNRKKNDPSKLVMKNLYNL